MVDFVYLGVLAGLLFGSGNLADKYLMANRDEKGIVPAVLSGFIGLIPAAVILVYTGIPSNYMPLIWATLGGFFIFGGRYTYFKALETGEASDITVLANLTPLFVFVMSVIFLSQSFQMFELVGFTLMFLGGLVISAKDFDPGKMRFNKATTLIILAVILYAVTDVLMKVSTNTIAYLPAYASALVGAFFSSVLISLNEGVRGSLGSWKEKEYLKLLLPGRIFFYLGFLVFTLALETGKVALITASLNIRPIFVIATVIAFRKAGMDYFPDEDMSWKANILRLISVVMFVVGVYILTG